ncbi:hypothetical protein ONZ45_g12640 [Pleurotus djamor]|nr:hypothetical protein ONZ45_g12640 [Pleurotus djamor]
MLSAAEFLDTSPTIELVDKKILELRDEIRVLEHYRNARLLVVSRFPPEVLSTIFEYMAFGKLDSRMHTYRAYPWLAVTQVCRLWRNTALNTPRMWGCIYSHTNQDLVKLFLERAKSAPLYFRSNPYGGTGSATALILEHSAQLKELDLGHCSAQLRGLSQHPSPLLESFKASISASNYEHYPHELGFASDDTSVFPPLRQVELNNCHINFKARYLARIVVLNITYESYQNSALYTPEVPMPDVITALGKMECLTSLKLINVIGSSKDVADDTITQLPCLNNLHIEAKNVDSLSIIARINCPSVQSAVISLTELPAAFDPPVASIVHTFYALVPGTPSAWKTTLHVQSRQGACQTMMSIRPDSSVQRDDQSPPPFRLMILGPTDFSTCLSVSSLLPVTEPFTLDLRYSHQMPDAVLLTFLQSLTNVEELLIDDFEALVDIPKDTPAKGKGKRDELPPFALPSVKYLQLSQNGRIKYKDRNLKKFKKFLAARKAVGVGIEVFKLCGTGHIFDDELDIFRTEVGAIEKVPWRPRSQQGKYYGRTYFPDIY